MEKPLKKLKAKKKKLQFASLFVTIAPILTVIGINWQAYAPTVKEGVSISLGLVIGLGLIILVQAKKVEVKTPFTALLFLFGLAIVLKPIINDLILLSGVALGGSLIDFVFFRGAIADTEESITMKKSATINAEAMVEAQKIASSGRV